MWWMGRAAAGPMAGPAADNRVGAAVGALRVLGGAALAGIGEGGGGDGVGGAMVAVGDGRVRCKRCSIVSPHKFYACKRPDRLGRVLAARLK